MGKRFFTVDEYIPFPERYKCYRKNRIRYINMPNAFDIETSSFMDGKQYRACMYIWQMSIDGLIVIGRTWEEFIELIDMLADFYNTYKEKVLVIYVHNLSYEFQWMRHLFEWESVFSLEERKPVYARTTKGIEFRCSYILSGMSLERLGKNLIRHKIEKLTGNLDYGKIRHSGTKMTEDEISYCINDVKVVTAYIQERIEEDGNITKIPMTQTGYVRRATRNACFGTDHKKRQFKIYRAFITELSMEADEYALCKKAFMGGFTHANAFHVDKTITDVKSFDFTSSYPFCMIAFKYPMTKGEKVEVTFNELMEMKNRYAWVFQIAFKNLRTKITYEHYLSESRCRIEGQHDIDNGRVVYAEFLSTVITNVDLSIIEGCYEWDDAKVVTAYRYRWDYLPTPIIESLLNFYSAKTSLKNVAGREADYMAAKGNCNSNYGMMVTDPLRETVTYDGEWGTKEISVEEGIDKYNKSRQRFLFYPWGIFVTAWARRNLFTGIHEFKHDYIYSDTDSIKVMNADVHMDYIRKYNEWAVSRLHTAMEYHDLPFDLCNPKDINGDEHMLGVWDYEGKMSRFRTLGAKRYMTEKEGKVSLTVSGLNKKKAIPYLLDMYGKQGIFDAFTYDEITREGISVPAEHTGRITMRYIDDETRGTVTDYLGNEGTYHEMSSAHMENGAYSMSMGRDYISFLLGIREEDMAI